uniref:SFRICE_004630 n=1 Tax=Spodoptera frugiperda TaxID=7108 RepID=A0A2H1VUY8_SPOFR
MMNTKEKAKLNEHTTALPHPSSGTQHKKHLLVLRGPTRKRNVKTSNEENSSSLSPTGIGRDNEVIVQCGLLRDLIDCEEECYFSHENFVNKQTFAFKKPFTGSKYKLFILNHRVPNISKG